LMVMCYHDDQPCSWARSRCVFVFVTLLCHVRRCALWVCSLVVLWSAPLPLAACAAACLPVLLCAACGVLRLRFVPPVCLVVCSHTTDVLAPHAHARAPHYYHHTCTSPFPPVTVLSTVLHLVFSRSPAPVRLVSVPDRGVYCTVRRCCLYPDGVSHRS
jgi:hypothetical protein